MPTYTAYSPADVLAELLVQAGQVDDVDAEGQPGGAWPVYVDQEPDDQDQMVRIIDTEGVGGGPATRNHVDLVPRGLDGFQVLVRAADRRAAHEKASAIYDHLAQVVRRGVTINQDRYYLVHGCQSFGTILSLGRDPQTNRYWVSFNATVEVEDQTS